MALFLRLLLALAASLALPAWASSLPAPLSSAAPETASGVSAASVDEEHEYFVKGLATVKNDPRPSFDDPLKPGIGWDGSTLFVYTNGYRRDLRDAFTRLEGDVLAGGSARTHFETAVGRVASRVVAPAP